jgi:hypothetical protein
MVGLGEAIGCRIEILLVALWLEPERVEIGMKVPARPVGADQHERADGVARGLLDFGGGELDAGFLRARADFVGHGSVHLGPAVGAERRGDVVTGQERPVGALP